MMYKDYLSAIPEMKSGEVLNAALSVIPDYDDRIRNENTPTRLMALSDLYKLYIPSQMSLEIYSKLYLALLRSMQKKGTKTAIQQHYKNHKAIIGDEYNGIVGGSDSFTIIGCSGIGKSSAISRAITLISENRIIEIEKPYAKVIPCLAVQCPFDSSVKGLLLEILRKVDETLETNYYNYCIKSRTATTDMLIGLVSSIALNHIGILIVDEIQNVVNSRNGKNLVGMLTQLINNSGISICIFHLCSFSLAYLFTCLTQLYRSGFISRKQSVQLCTASRPRRIDLTVPHLKNKCLPKPLPNGFLQAIRRRLSAG